MKVESNLRRQPASHPHGGTLTAEGGHGRGRSWSVGRWVRALLRGGEEGAALIETALTLPILLGVVTGICSFGVGFNNQLALVSAVGAGAQHLQLIRTTSADPCAETLTAIEAAAPQLTPANITLSLNLDGTTVSGSSCQGDQVYLVQGQQITVTAKYPCALAIYGTSFTNACQLSAKVTEYEY